ncbi:protein of unknown function DUF1822 (plasmid) [Stanieria cyanosphaera PCC 7437]|uniref:TRADD-like N-terminal domain-containing protein n=1 Tax=Stanieria cyanosphaera (strain ATCC 29371 / PCC 7437) TaxID=111780 RepID=K9Y2Q2_STAC7|nr:DUF1822 family protein [Stanieria cyanosphaera]AFZ38307.1 protein of unknown function DUF1822 [Stanieria cyanosphaera PCC 7437]
MNHQEKLEFIKVFLNQTPRTQEVLIEFINSNNYQDIAKKLKIEPNTASQHITKVCKELKLRQKFPDLSSKEISLELRKLLNLYIDDIAVDKISQALSLTRKTVNYRSRQDFRQGQIIIIIDINPLQINFNFLCKFLKEIQRFFGNDVITIKKIEDGSIKLTITGTLEGCQRIKSQFDAGELTEILESRVIDVSLVEVEVETENNLWTNLSNWLQSNILPDWELEEIVGATITALRTNPDFFATPAFGSLMGNSNEEELTSISELLANLNNEDLNIVRLAAQELGSREANNREVIARLKEKLNTINDLETQWQIALTLGKIAPEKYLQAKAQKQIIELDDTSLELVLAIKNEDDDFIDILVEIRPDWNDYLPIGLEAKILEESGEDFWQDDFVSTQLVTDSRAYIYFNFWGMPGDRFILQLSLNHTILQKNFQI